MSGLTNIQKTAQAAQQLEQWNKLLAGVIAAQGSNGFYAALTKAIVGLVWAEFPQVWLFQVDKAPRVLYHTIDADHQEVHIDEYIAGAYESDPAYKASLKASDDSVYRVTELNDGQLSQNEYLTGYFKAMRIGDEMGFVIQVAPGVSLNLTFQRRKGERIFSEDEVGLFRNVESIVRQLCIKHWQINRDEKGDVGQASEHVDKALKLFGTSLLTERELDALQQILMGHSNQSASDKMGVSLETMRRHRKHVYQKLDIGSQGELFSLFIHSMPFLATHPDQDPLLQYHSSPSV